MADDHFEFVFLLLLVLLLLLLFISTISFILLVTELATRDMFCLVRFDSLRPINNLSVIKGRVFMGCTSTKLGLMSCPRTQHSGAGKARARDPSVSSQALYH